MSVPKRVKIIVPSESIIEKRQRAVDERAPTITVVSIEFDPTKNRFELVMKSGINLSIPRSQIEEFDEIDSDALRNVQIGLGGDVIELEDHDIHISVPGLLRDIFGLNIGQRNGGRSRSPAKVSAARANGASGGRPPKAIR